MTDAVVVALITGAAAVIAQLIIARVNNKELFAELERKSELTDHKLEAKIERYAAVTDAKLAELTREVRDHNGFARRMPVLEEKVQNLERKSQ